MEGRQLLHVGPMQSFGEHEEAPDSRLGVLREEVAVEEVEPVRGVVLPARDARGVEAGALLRDGAVGAEELPGEERARLGVEGDAALRRLWGGGQHEAHDPVLLDLQRALVPDDLDGELIKVLRGEFLPEGDSNDVGAVHLQGLRRGRPGLEDCVDGARLLAVEELQDDDHGARQNVTADGLDEFLGVALVVDADEHGRPARGRHEVGVVRAAHVQLELLAVAFGPSVIVATDLHDAIPEVRPDHLPGQLLVRRHRRRQRRPIAQELLRLDAAYGLQLRPRGPLPPASQTAVHGEGSERQRCKCWRQP
mmetsp:Transcript_13018/g.40226  ORF Transcript_13018/g.40226 Transcript_13018/m.40226 type:complete len:308 (-) Transcript_13018:10-933(-)